MNLNLVKGIGKHFPQKCNNNIINYQLIHDIFQGHCAHHSVAELRASNLSKLRFNDTLWSFVAEKSLKNAVQWNILTPRFEGFCNQNRYIYYPYTMKDASRIVTVTDSMNIQYVMDDILEQDKLDYKSEWIAKWCQAYRSGNCDHDGYICDDNDIANQSPSTQDWTNLKPPVEQLSKRIYHATAELSKTMYDEGSVWIWERLTSELICWLKTDSKKIVHDCSTRYIESKPTQCGMIPTTLFLQYIYDWYLTDEMINTLGIDDNTNNIEILVENGMDTSDDDTILSLWYKCEHKLHLVFGLLNDLLSFPKEVNSKDTSNVLYYVLHENGYCLNTSIDILIKLINQYTLEFQTYHELCKQGINNQFNNIYDICLHQDFDSKEINDICVTEGINHNMVGFCKILDGFEMMLDGCFKYQTQESRHKASKHIITEMQTNSTCTREK